MTILDGLGPVNDARFEQVTFDVDAAQGSLPLIVYMTTEKRPGGGGIALSGQDERGGRSWMDLFVAKTFVFD
jgi:hypothetical protein